jgi:hypothetical protein
MDCSLNTPDLQSRVNQVIFWASSGLLPGYAEFFNIDDWV